MTSVAQALILKRDLDVPKSDGNTPTYEPTSAEVDAALTHRKVLKICFGTIAWRP